MHNKNCFYFFYVAKTFFFVFVDILIVFSKKISIEKKLSIFFSLVKIATEPIEIFVRH